MTFMERLEEALCVYKSTRFIRVRNHKLVAVYYSCLLIVLLYICLYTIWYDGGYQAQCLITGTSSAKLKGTGSVGGSVGSTDGTVYDAMDLVFPALEEDAFFATTSMILTANQSRGKCPGNKDVPACDSSNYTTVCVKGTYDSMSQGIWTGQCCTANGNCSAQYTPNDRCEVKSWCPTEDDSSSAAVKVVNVGTFTAFIKVDVEFADPCSVSRSNTLDRAGTGAPVDGYNLFSLDEIVGNATGGVSNVSDIAGHGGIVLMESSWVCDFDKGADGCDLDWKFYRIDSEPDTISSGFNYRTISYDTNMESRLLRKLYGLRVIFTTSGMGRKFSFAQLTVTFGAGLAYLGVAAFLTDIVLEKFLPQSDQYERLKNKDDRVISQRNVNLATAADAEYHDLSLSTHDDAEQNGNAAGR
eukprot:CAMPEP_0197047796 /NCGR_PEP_ID=MMETSP1384-20130603/23241_1 /TAXON_ID=29189 /ORGANISM="Ammonia sp." /LENGTH=412 /DNA_ID=CAMNT_0042479799 /DNA_START=36 /DNA_END=1274 /DNA_ORIENTATION=-